MHSTTTPPCPRALLLAPHGRFPLRAPGRRPNHLRHSNLRYPLAPLSGSQDPANTPTRVAPTPQKRVTSRRFLPFGNSNASTPSNPPSSNPPRKSLGDVFALGRSSTSSRLDAASTRSGTPSGRSSRSVTSAATLRGWGSTSKHLEPGPHSRLSFNRPRSHDYTLDSDLGFVVAIGASDETVRQRPGVSASGSSPLIAGATPPVQESSQEDIVLPSSDQANNPAGISSLGQATCADPASVYLGTSALSPNHPETASTNGSLNSPKFSAKRPPPLNLKPSAGAPAEVVKTLVTTPECYFQEENPASAVYSFAPVDDRSDVTSSTRNTPSSVRKPSGSVQPVVDPLPSPSPFRALPGGLGMSTQPETSMNNIGLAGPQNPWADHVIARAGVDTPQSRADFEEQASMAFSASRTARREHAIMGLLGELDGALSAASSESQARSKEPTTAGDEKAFVGTAGLAVVTMSEGDLTCADYTHPIISNSGQQTTLSGHRNAAGARQEMVGRPSITLPPNSVERQEDHLDSVIASDHPPSPLLGDLVDTSQPTPGHRDIHTHSYTINADPTKPLLPNRQSRMSFSAPNSAPIPTISLPPDSPGWSPSPLPFASQAPARSSPENRAESGSLHVAATPSPSASFRSSDVQVPLKPQLTGHGVSSTRSYQSARNSPVLTRAVPSTPSLGGFELSNVRDILSPLNSHSRTLVQHPSTVGATVTRKRSASFDLSGSVTFAKDFSDPFTSSYSSQPRRTDWLGPRTAKAFAAAGLLDNKSDKDHASPVFGARSDSPRGALWRTQQSESGRPGGPRSHSRLGSEIISPSSRSRGLAKGTDYSPSFRRSSLDHTAPPSPVSTHRTLVSSTASSSQSHPSALQTLRERHELETEALLLALAGSKKSEKDLRLENEQLLAYIKQLEQRVIELEQDRDREGSKWRTKRHAWDTASTSNIDKFDRRRQDTFNGRPSTRAWSIHSRTKSTALNRSSAYGATHASSVLSEAPRSASVTEVFRNGDFGTKLRSTTPPANRSMISDSMPIERTHSANTSAESERWHEDPSMSYCRPNLRSTGPQTLANNSVTSLLPQLPGAMSLIMQEAGPLSEDDYSFGSGSPSSLTLVHPRNSTPKPCPPNNISPVTAEFSFNSIPASPRSLRLRPDEEMHLADLISLQGLEVTDVLDEAD
ncbi:Arginine-glutamic acid dipeptide repeats protein [Ceratobasidium sp. AG-Ba]|nr:Arginine-glutamic acid dipeptide repeats protein [Ceratobasidium sp. AG-Ba]